MLLRGIVKNIRKNINIVIVLLPIFAFIVPLTMLYILYPYTYEQTLQARTFYLFFLWLVFMELILSWETFRKKKVDNVGGRIRIILLITVLLLPTLYVIVANFYGLNATIENIARQNIPPADPLKEVHASLLPLSIEYLVFALLFCIIILSAYGIAGLKDFSISTIFLGIIGVLYTIDNLYPAGRSPLQLFVPATTLLAANVLNLMGYQTSIFSIKHQYYGDMSILAVKDYPQVMFGIAWPCAGVESLLIYTVTILLFLKKTKVPWKHKAIYFVFGAVMTYFINGLRIVTLYLIAIEKSPNFTITDYDFQRFHNYYGSLYSIIWIISYPLLIIVSRVLWRKIKNWKADTEVDAVAPTVSSELTRASFDNCVD